MNRFILSMAFLVATVYCLNAETPATVEQEPPARTEPVKDVYPRWSVVGEWRVTHPAWTDIVTLKEDGTLVTSRQGTTGRWILTGDGGTPLLVIRWDLFATESVAMVSPDHFRGQTKSGRFIDMRREDDSRNGSASNVQH